MIITKLSQISESERLSWLGHPYAIDVETTGVKYWEDDLIGVALFVNEKSYYFVLKHTLDDGVTVQDYLSLAEVQHILRPIMAQPEVTVCGHNLKFDIHFFERFNLPLRSRIFDTLQAGKLLDENRRNGLKELAHLVDADHHKYETLVEWNNFPKGCPLNVPLEPFANYAELDVIVTYKLWLKFREELPNDEWKGKSLQDAFNTIYMPMTTTLQRIEAIGMGMNIDEAKKLYDKYTTIAAEKRLEVERAGYKMLAAKDLTQIRSLYWKILREEEEDPDDFSTDSEGNRFLNILGVDTPIIRPTKGSKERRLYFNVGSSQQLIDLIMDGVEWQPHWVPLEKTKNDDDSVNVRNLKLLQHYLGDAAPPYIDDLFEWRKADKFAGTYLKVFIEKSDSNNRLHGSFSTAEAEGGKGGTRTGRLSSAGPNLQNIPSRGAIGDEARGLFIPDEGNVLIVADYSNMETVIFAHYSKDAVLLKAFNDGLDVHALTACGQHGLDYDDFVARYADGDPQYDAMRRVAKTVLFGSAYGMGAPKLRRTLLVENGQEYSLAECKHTLQAFNSTYQGMTDWKEKVIAFASKHGFVPTLSGRKRRLPRVFDSDPWERGRAARQGVNAVIQGSCADIMFQAMIPIQAAFEAMGGSLIASVHDELIAELPEEFAEVGCNVMGTLMVDQINPQLNCKLKAEAHYGKSWLEAKKGH